MLPFTLPFLDSIGAPVLACVFIALLFLQWKFPLRLQHFATLPRVLTNLIFALPAFVALRLTLLPIPLAAALWAQRHHCGLLHWIDMAPWLKVLFGIMLMDYAYYWWHIATHRVPLLWRFHNVHHTDLDMDVSTAMRFHFGELLLSVAFRVLAVLLFGLDWWTLLLFEVLFESAAQFHHSNWRLPLPVERALNLIIVTPRMHGIHHSIVRDETDSNWGTIFSWWDKLHRTWRLDIAQHDLTIGVPAYREPAELTIGALWKMPFTMQRDWQLPDGSKPERRDVQE